MLGYAIETALGDAELTLQRLSRAGVLSDALSVLHPRLGTATRLADIAAIAAIVAIYTTGGHVQWLARAYAVGIVWAYVFGLAALVRLSRRPASVGPSATPPETNGLWTRPHRSSWAIGVVLSGLALLVAGDGATWAGTIALVGVAILLIVAPAREASRRRRPRRVSTAAADRSLDRSRGRTAGQSARRGAASAVALPSLRRTPRSARPRRRRDDGTADRPGRRRRRRDRRARPTADERLLFSQVTAIAERTGREIRLLIVPAHDAFDAVIASVIRLRSSEVYVGESLVLSADEQARRLGEAWERADKTAHLNVRLVIHHRSGRTHSYFLGAHAPSLSDSDLELIHRLWLDAAKTVGPHVHHHDIVRAALTQMAEKLDGPNRDTAVEAIREVARPAEEVAALVRARDLSQLRDMMRNRPPQDVAHMLSHLGIEDQVIVFRVLPRKDAAAAFEYLSQDTQQVAAEGHGPAGNRAAC